MQSPRLILSFASALALAFPVAAKADHGAHAYTTGAFATGTLVGQNITLSSATLSGTHSILAFSCPISSYGAGTYAINWSCSGGKIGISSSDKSLTLAGTFLAGSMTYTGSGGGKGGHSAFIHAFHATFRGVVTIGSVSQMVLGEVSQSVSTPGGIEGELGWNSAYSPLFVGDPSLGRLLSADNITGANLEAYGSKGSGIGHFEAITGLAEDVGHRVYISDGVLDHIVRIDDMTGRGWSELGSAGAGIHEFSRPSGIAIDASGKIWVADTGNNRIVRFDDMTGTAWTTFGSAGAGINEFDAPSAIAIDAQERIYIADKGNNRVVRVDDLKGTHWSTLSKVTQNLVGYALTAPTSVAIDGLGRLNIALGSGYLVRVADITGAQPSVTSWGGALSSMSLDKSGSIYVTGGFTGGLAQGVDAEATGYFNSNLGGAVTGPSVVLAGASSSPPPASPLLSASSIQFGSADIGAATATQAISLENLGGDPLKLTSITAGVDFPLSDTCPNPLPGGATCRIGIELKPTKAGVLAEALTVKSQSVHPSVTVALSGDGTSSKPVVSPGALAFGSQMIGTTGVPQAVTLTNTGTGTLAISAVAVTAEFLESHNCPKILAHGSGCTIEVSFHPAAAGLHGGTLSISTDATPGGLVSVALSGTGTAAAPPITLAPQSLHFPDQQIGTSSPSASVTLTNTSGATLALSTASIPAGFKVSTTCPKTLANRASCTYSVEFAPASAGVFAGSLTIPVTGKPSLVVGLSGTAVATGGPSQLVANPSSISFLAITLGDNPSITTALTNPGGVSLGIRSVALTGDSVFSLTGSSCAGVLASHASCTVEVTFQPVGTATFAYSGTVAITDTTGAQTKIPVTGQSVLNGN